MKAEQWSEPMGDEGDEADEAMGYHNPWAETAMLFDLAIEFWREENFPKNARHRSMTTLLEAITQTVQSYLPRP